MRLDPVAVVVVDMMYVVAAAVATFVVLDFVTPGGGAQNDGEFYDFLTGAFPVFPTGGLKVEDEEEPESLLPPTSRRLSGGDGWVARAPHAEQTLKGIGLCCN